MADEDICTDDEDVTFETYVDEGSDTLVDEFEDPAVTELDTVGGVVESVQFSTSSTLSSIGIRVMIQVFVTAPIGLGIFSDDDINPEKTRHTNCRVEYW